MVLTASPVHAAAEDLGLPVFTPSGIMKKFPDSAAFLDSLRELGPDLCITAAYGQFLTKSFLDIPRYGTLNIHPSLLPKFRGAAPVPRSLEAGVKVTGVSVLFTALKMDSGPILAQETMALTGDEKADGLLPVLFDKGSDLLVSSLGRVWSGEARQDGHGCTLQDEKEATEAAKMTKDEGRLWFTENAVYMHNKVRAFAGWPGTSAEFVLDPDGEKETLKVKIVSTRLLRPHGGMALGVHRLRLNEKGDAIVVTCDDGSQLEVTEIQPPGKKVMDARSFWNGLRGKPLERARVPWSTGPVPGGF